VPQAVEPLTRQAILTRANGRGTESEEAGRLAFQAAVAPAGGTGVSLSARATVSPDRQYLRLTLTPLFRTGSSAQSAPPLNVPLIPGGAAP
jgi:hypothetical protein